MAAADAARQQGSLKEAVIHYKSALQLTPEDLPTRWHLGQTYLALNQPAAALSELSRAEALAATTPAVSLDLAQAQIDLARYAEANTTLDSYRGPRTPELDAMKVKAKLGLGHTARQSAFLRGRNVSHKVAGLYYAGHSTLPGIGLPMCLIGAELVYKHLAGDRSTGAIKKLKSL